jgi:hypothetical protein
MRGFLPEKTAVWHLSSVLQYVLILVSSFSMFPPLHSASYSILQTAKLVRWKCWTLLSCWTIEICADLRINKPVQPDE